jgi:hypothetical protein
MTNRATDSLETWVSSLPNASALREDLAATKGKRVLLVGHEDPDGITSTLLMARALGRLGAEVAVRLPPGFVLEQELAESYVGELHPDVLVILDKGTLPGYGAFAGLVERVLVVDHHPSDSPPAGVRFVNPCLRPGLSISNSFLVFALLQPLAPALPADHLLNLIGLTGDFAINVAADVVREPDLVGSYLEGTPEVLAPLFRKEGGRLTMFDVYGREVTAPLNRIAELVHAVGGGAFGYYYHEYDESLRDLDHAAFIYEQLAAYCAEKPELPGLGDLDAFIAELPDPRRVSLIRRFFEEDWERYSRKMDAVFPLARVRGVEILAYVGENIRLMPMIGSIKLHRLAEARGLERAAIMLVSLLRPHGVHVSMRGTSPNLDLGSVCRSLAERLRRRLGDPAPGGGGHPVAAEMVAATPRADALVVLHELTALLEELRASDADGETAGGAS